ncbi:hypothetical protein P154DRAFT_493768 [Amniculicola lignicola CBS 123094]|uniref:Nucleoside phosphorylase domain-containing protein n=1 Tax=Amniculicola lignicola CBS 123094 TaxID=1392246 RepID=A0A6A5WGN6_9PLEO|nr:hypothetical protein P154DRAFT_493768 [Amniculicola lignicola CBS 123094]
MSPRVETDSLTHADYSVGWICALPTELTAAKAVLEKTHSRLSTPGDPNAYTLGSIGEHNIVVFCLPTGRYGNNLAATAVTSMLSSFQSVRCVLLVGIGGGVHPKVRLGDIVVGEPKGRYPGVVQWDMGKTTQGGKFEPTGALDNPRMELLTALGDLKSDHDLNGGPQFPEYIEELRETRQSLSPRYFRSGSMKDDLYRADYDHVKKRGIQELYAIGDNDEDEEEHSEDEEVESCKYCDPTKIVKRRRVKDPRVHYGLIASGNQVIKEAKHRDKINEDFGGEVLCVEMEAAGVLAKCPCLVIRGICDYADSHKNKVWQKPAALAAAAFAKEFLHILQPQKVEEMAVIKVIKEFHRDVETEKILDWLSPLRFTDHHAEILEDIPKDTGTGIFKESQFIEWIEGKDNRSKTKTLWCHGIPGAGKTVVAAIVADFLRKQHSKNHPNVGIATVYCDYAKKESQSADNLVRSIYQQALEWMEEIPSNLREMYQKSYSKPPPLPSMKDISAAFATSSGNLSTLFIVLDALDEASETVQDSIVRRIQELPFLDIRLFCTSRPLTRFHDVCKGSPQIEIKASEKDIATFVNSQIEASARVLKLMKDAEGLRQEIVLGITDKAKGMFLMAKLHIGGIMSASSQTDIRNALRDLSAEINDTYKQSMERIRSQQPSDRDLAERALSWVFGSRRPLSMVELQHALATSRLKTDQEEVAKEDMPHEEIILTVCQGLLIQEKVANSIRLSWDFAEQISRLNPGHFIRAVHYTAAEYFNEHYNEEFPHGEAEIARVCVAYLSLRGLSHIFKSYGWAIQQYGQEKPRNWVFETRRRFPLFHYAGKYWSSHLCDASALGLRIRPSDIFWEYNGVSSDEWEEWFSSQKVTNRVHGISALLKFAIESLKLWKEVLEQVTQGEHDINAVDESGRTMLLHAIYSGNVDATKFLLMHHKTIIKQAELESEDLLYISIVQNLPGVVKALLSMITIRDEKANERGQETVPSPRQSHGIYSLGRLRSLQMKTVQIRSDKGPFTRTYRSARILRMLLDKTKRFEPKDGWDFLQLALADSVKYDKKLCAFLLKRVLNLNARDDTGNTLLHRAVVTNHPRSYWLVERLLEAGANIHHINHLGETPLLYVARNRSVYAEKMIQKLLHFGANPNVKSSEGSTALGCIIQGIDFSEFTPSSTESLVKTLLKGGADPNLRIRFHESVLFLLMERSESMARSSRGLTEEEVHSMQELMWLLLDAGADVTFKNANDKTPGDCALEGSNNIFSLMLAVYEYLNTSWERVPVGGPTKETLLSLVEHSDINYLARNKMLLKLRQAVTIPVDY